MQVDRPENIRNLAVVGHNGTGKTTLVSALLYTGGVTTRLHKVEDGNAITDFDPEEQARHISIGVAACHVGWQGAKVNLVDCPGYGIFLHEIRCGQRAADAALLCVDTVSGPQVTTEKVWEYAAELQQPAFLCLTRMDRENADWERALAAVREIFGRACFPVQIPIGAAQSFSGVVDLVRHKAITFQRDGNGKGKEEEVPAALAGTAADWRSKLVEAVAESDEKLMETFFEQGDLTQDELEAGLRRAILQRSVFPVLVTSALHGIGSSALLDILVAAAPTPVDRPYAASDAAGQPLALGARPAAIVFKTIQDPLGGKISLLRVAAGALASDTTYWNPRAGDAERVGHLMAMQGKQGEAIPKLISGDIGGVSRLKLSHTGDTLCDKAQPVQLPWVEPAVAAMAYAIEPRSKGDEEKIGEAVARLIEEDPGLHAGRDPQTGEYLLSGTGELHVEIAVGKLKSRYKVDVILHPPKVPYRETIRRSADGHGRHKKQTGGRGQFADCKISVEPQPRGAGFEFKDEIFGGAIPHNFRPAVEKGIVEAAHKGFLAGCPVVDFCVRLLDGQYHDVDSSELAFKIAGSLAFKEAMAKANPVILEPIMHVEIVTTEEWMGDVMGDLSQRRGKPQGMDTKGQSQVIKASVPLSEMLNYAPALRSMTQGRSSFTMEFSHYEEAPRAIQDKIVAETKRHAESEAS